MKFLLVAAPDHVELPAVEGLLIAATVHVLEPTTANVRAALAQLTNDVNAYLKHSYEPPPHQQLDPALIQAGVKFDTTIGDPSSDKALIHDLRWEKDRSSID